MTHSLTHLVPDPPPQDPFSPLFDFSRGLLVELWPRVPAMDHPNCAFGVFWVIVGGIWKPHSKERVVWEMRKGGSGEGAVGEISQHEPLQANLGHSWSPALNFCQVKNNWPMARTLDGPWPDPQRDARKQFAAEKEAQNFRPCWSYANRILPGSLFLICGENTNKPTLVLCVGLLSSGLKILVRRRNLILSTY